MQTAKLLIRKRYYEYIPFIIPVLIVQVTELVQFIINVRKFHASHRFTCFRQWPAGREGRTILGTQAKPLFSQMALSWKPFRIGHMFI